MKKMFIIGAVITMMVMNGCSSKPKSKTNSMVFVEGGSFVSTNTNYADQNTKVNDFYISKYEITQKEWEAVMGDNPSKYMAPNHPVENITWYDSIEYCNKRSEQEGLQPYYNIDKDNEDPENVSPYDDVKWIVTINEDANGYRLPTEVEWEYAATGGQKSKNTKYSGGNKVDKVSWNWRNSGKKHIDGDWNWTNIEANEDMTHTVGEKIPNELGLYDMSGNVREWCYDWFSNDEYEVGYYRSCRGGGWIGDITSCEITYRGKFEANGYGPDQGLRVCRNSDK